MDGAYSENLGEHTKTQKLNCSEGGAPITADMYGRQTRGTEK